MQKVSAEYAASMASPLRERGFIKVVFGDNELIFENDDVLSSSLESYVNPIGADVPQIDFSVTLQNYDHRFDVDNPNSVIDLLNTGEPMDVWYGYWLPQSEEIEWIQGGHLVCSSWQVDDYEATIYAQDIFRNMDTEYNKGQYYPDGISYYDLAVDVLTDAGITDYEIAERLKGIYTKNPLPRVKHKEALQIIANATRCVLLQTRDGKIQIKSNFVPPISTLATSAAYWSNLNNVLSSESKEVYAILDQDFIRVDGTPRVRTFGLVEAIGDRINSGYASDIVSDSSGRFSVPTLVYYWISEPYTYKSVTITFGEVLPTSITILTSLNNVTVDTTVYSSGITKTMTIPLPNTEIDGIGVFVNNVETPYNRAYIDSVILDPTFDFTYTRDDMLSSPRATRQDMIKNIVVPCYLYGNGAAEQLLVSEEVTASKNQTITFYLTEPCHSYRAVFDGKETNAEITYAGSYAVTVKFKKAGTFEFDLFGKKYDIVETYATVNLHEKGQTVRWENPLISDVQLAQDLADWLSDYYSSSIEYEFDSRGNPEIDVNDIVYQANPYVENMRVNVFRTKLTFAQSFKGHVVTRRLGG